MARRLTLGVLEQAMKALPPSRLVELRASTRVVERLDYARHEVLLRAEDLTELLRARACEKEPETVAWIERTVKPGDVFYDVGANVGAYSFVAKFAVEETGLVYAFEPSTPTFMALAENVWLNRCVDSVIPMQLGLSDKTALLLLHGQRAAGASMNVWGASAPEKAAAGGPNWSQHVLCYALDDLIAQFGLRPPTHIKIDVDGVENRVIAGARRTLRAGTLRTLLIEARDTKQSHEEIIQPVLDAGFVVTEKHPRGENWVNHIFERPQGAKPTA
jgi:FkbM family methyltransferase